MPTVDVPESVLSILRCPHCRGRLTVGAVASCQGCGVMFATAPTFDLRPQTTIDTTMPLRVGGAGPAHPDAIVPLRPSPSPEVEFGAVLRPDHITAALRSWVPAAPRPGAVALDLGCGAETLRPTLEHAGYEYLGMDYEHPGAPMWGDAHVLPLADASLDLVISLAVLEHLHTPLRAVQEVARALRPGGAFMGTVAFMEPYHDRSYFHCSALAVLHLLRETGLEPAFVAPQADWTVLDAQPKALYPRMPRRVQRVVTAPQRWLTSAWWAGLRVRNRRYFTTGRRLTSTTGAFEFLARKPGG